jgi:hypothetical protein
MSSLDYLLDDADVAKRALDELFVLAQQYRSTSEYLELMRFIARFTSYAPFNAMLVRVQMPGAAFVAPPSRWLREFQRHVKPNARPLVILQPGGPVMFVYDVSDTEPMDGAAPLPPEVLHPFEIRGAMVGSQLDTLAVNVVRDGVRIQTEKRGSQGAGRIGPSSSGQTMQYPRRLRPRPDYVTVPVRYELLLNESHSRETHFATLVHELAHLYCGHLGTPNPLWWPSRRFLDADTEEFEAESVSYLVCRSLGLDTRSEAYLSGYTRERSVTPQMSLECVLKAAGDIERMTRERHPPRKEKSK